MKRVANVKRESIDHVKGRLDRGPREFKTRIRKDEGTIMEIANTKVVVMPPTTTIMSLVKTMVQYGYRRIPVADPGTNRIQGIVTSVDIIDFLGGGDKHKLVEEKYDNNLLIAINEEVKEIMEKDVVVAHFDDDIEDVLYVMLEHGLGGIPVVDDEDCVMGIVAERDFMRYVVELNVDGLVQDYMTRDVMAVEPKISIEKASETMVKNGFRRLPVIKEGILIGIITATDIVRYLGSGEVFGKLITGNVHEAFSCPIKNIMTRNVLSVSPDESVGIVARLMVEKRVGGFPVISDGELHGIITERDLLKTLV
jgi:CBS domain-containing protein